MWCTARDVAAKYFAPKASCFQAPTVTIEIDAIVLSQKTNPRLTQFHRSGPPKHQNLSWCWKVSILPRGTPDPTSKAERVGTTSRSKFVESGTWALGQCHHIGPMWWSNHSCCSPAQKWTPYWLKHKTMWFDKFEFRTFSFLESCSLARSTNEASGWFT